MKYEEINFVARIENPANVPKVRSIEDFWELLKQKVYENDWSARNITQLKKRIEFCLRKMDKSLIRETAGSVHRLLKIVDKLGIDALKN